MNKKPKTVALTTKTLCMAKINKCPFCVIGDFGSLVAKERWDCWNRGYGVPRLANNKNGYPKRHKQCRTDFPDIIVMTSLKGGK